MWVVNESVGMVLVGVGVVMGLLETGLNRPGGKSVKTL
jgi:hypothetical protein